MTTRTIRTLAVCVAFLFVGIVVLGQTPPLKLTHARPTDMRFTAKPNGTFQADIVGDSAQPGLYAVETRLPAGIRIPPHFHPEARIVFIVKGTLYVGFGETFDEAKMIQLPAGSVFTEPPRQVHYTWAKDGEVLLHVTGEGPTGTTWLGR